jgi:hypothetical protein
MLLDYFVDFDLKINNEVSKLGANILHGFIDMKRDINLKLTQYHKELKDTRQAFIFNNILKYILFRFFL